MLKQKISHESYRDLISKHSVHFSQAEHDLLAEILSRFQFDVIQEQALAQAVLQQSRFNPNENHIADDDDGVAICAHCLNPPVPPLRDYLMWREQNS